MSDSHCLDKECIAAERLFASRPHERPQADCYCYMHHAFSTLWGFSLLCNAARCPPLFNSRLVSSDVLQAELSQTAGHSCVQCPCSS